MLANERRWRSGGAGLGAVWEAPTEGHRVVRLRHSVSLYISSTLPYICGEIALDSSFKMEGHTQKAGGWYACGVVWLCRQLREPGGVRTVMHDDSATSMTMVRQEHPTQIIKVREV